MDYCRTASITHLLLLARVAPSLFHSRLSPGRAEIAARKQSTAFEKSPDRLNRTPSPVCG